MAEPLNTAAQSFDALYRESARDLYAYVRTLLHDDASAEDVTALAFERAYRRRKTFDVRRGSQRAWLFGIARNAALDELRRRRRSAPLVAELEDERMPALDEQAEQSLRRARAARPGDRRAEVPRRAVQRRARRRARHEPIQRRDPAAPGRHEAEGGVPCAVVNR